MAQPAAAAATKEDYTKIYWVEAFAKIIEEPTLEKDQLYYYSRVLVSHTLANNILRDQKLSDPDYQTRLIDTFYQDYSNVKENKNALLKTVFMQTLVDIDPSKMKLGPKDKEYIEKVALGAALRAKDFTRLLSDEDKKAWLIPYMYAKTPPSVIAGNVKMFELFYDGLGAEQYNQMINRELCITSGPKVVPAGTADLFNQGWYTLYTEAKFSLNRVKHLKEVMEDPKKLNGETDSMIGSIFFKLRQVQETLPQNLRDLFWSTKISNLTTFIEQVSRTNQLVEKKT